MKRTLLAILMCGLLCACTSSRTQAERQAWNIAGVPGNKILVMGKIELHPPLSDEEQLLKGSRGEALRNAFVLFCGDQLKDLVTRMPDDLSGGFDITPEKEFLIMVDRDKPFFLAGGIFYTAYDPPANIKYQTFPSPLTAKFKQGDEAVYIGTIQYYRDAENRLTSVMIRDDFQWAETRLKERLSSFKTIRKALVAPVQ